MYRIADLKNRPRCVCCGCGDSTVKPSQVRFLRRPGFGPGDPCPEFLCSECWRWAMLWGVGQGPAADDLVRCWMKKTMQNKLEGIANAHRPAFL